MKTDKSVAEKIGVAPTRGDYPPSYSTSRPRYVTATNVPTLPDDFASNQQNIIQGRASCGEREPNVFRPSV